MAYQIVRTYSAGVFAGETKILTNDGKRVEIRNARRLWCWAGAATLSELAQRGTSKPNQCKFPVPVDRLEVTEAIELIDVTEAGRASIEAVPVWTE